MRHAGVAALLGTLIIAAAACGPAPSSSRSPTRPDATAVTAPSPAASGSGGSSSSVPPLSAAPATSFDPTGVTVDVSVAVTGLTAPLEVANAGDGSGRLFVAEQAGRIRVVRDGALLDRPLLDIRDRIASGGERGLLGLAFHPDYPADPRFFVNYTDRDGNTVVSQFTVSGSDPDLADPASEVVLLHFDQPYANHNGGAVVFGPDGMLYIATGDGGSGGDPQGNGQRLDTYLAKILRIDVGPATGGAAPYTVPSDNPFLARAGARPEIWLTGLRNPWRIRFDRATGDLWMGDVGQGQWEEVDVARAGAKGLNYGWNIMEGAHCFDPASGCDQTGLTLPVAEYDHDFGCAIIGGVVVRDPRQGRLDGGYLFGDACSDNLWLMDPTGNGLSDPMIVTKLGRTLSSFGEGEDGSVYATSLGSGELLRIAGPVS
ncbi:MAG: PQQ-dependent sugar dehydrogenase [Chloroflexota bacterium]